MTSQLYFVTGNSGKFKEISNFFKKNAPHITIVQKELDVPEVQSLDLEYVAREKAKAAWQQLKAPLIIDDGGIYLEAYNNFPGPLSKHVVHGIGLEGFLKLAREHPKSSFRTCIVHVDTAGSTHMFHGVCMGTIVEPKPGTFDPILPYRALFKPDGKDATYDQLDDTDKEQWHHRAKALRRFLDWYEAK